MKISVIIPIYNAALYLKECLDSILNQTYKNIEIILVNDGSTDESEKIIMEYVDDRIIYLKQENSGQAVARNKALAVATGDYIYFVDSDDFIDINSLQILMNEVNRNNSDIVCHKSILYYEDHMESFPFDIRLSNDNIRNFILTQAGPCAKLIKKTLIVDNDLYFLENHFYEDLAVVPAYAQYASKITFIDDELYFYRQRMGSTMNQVEYNKKFEDIFNALDTLTSYFEKGNSLEKFKDEVEFVYIEHLLHSASLRFFKFKEGIKNIEKIYQVMKNKYPNYRKNKYFKAQNIKYKIVCILFYKKKYNILKKIIKHHWEETC